MASIAILNSHPVSVLKKEISKTNIKGYSKMKKPELVALMMKKENKPRFKHIKMKEGKSAPAPKVVAVKKKPKKKPPLKIKLQQKLLTKAEAKKKLNYYQTETGAFSSEAESEYLDTLSMNMSVKQAEKLMNKRQARAIADFWSGYKASDKKTEKDWEMAWKEWQDDIDLDTYDTAPKKKTKKKRVAPTPKSPLTIDETEDLQNFETNYRALARAGFGDSVAASSRPYGTYDDKEVADQMERSYKAYLDFRKSAPAEVVLKFMKTKLSKAGLPLNRVDKAADAETMEDNIRYQVRKGSTDYKNTIMDNDPLVYRGEVQDYMRAFLKAADKIKAAGK